MSLVNEAPAISAHVVLSKGIHLVASHAHVVTAITVAIVNKICVRGVVLGHCHSPDVETFRNVSAEEKGIEGAWRHHEKFALRHQLCNFG